MLDKLRALFDGKTTTRLVLAGVAIAWGIQTITDTIRDMEAHADELAELITLRQLQLADLGDPDDELTLDISQGHPAGQGRPVPPPPLVVHDDFDMAGHDESVAMFHANLGDDLRADGLVP